METAFSFFSTSALNKTHGETNRIVRRKTTKLKTAYSSVGTEKLLVWFWKKLNDRF